MTDEAPTGVRMSALCDGSVTESRLSHPEGVAVDAGGFIWCGGDRGEIYRIVPDGGHREVVASTDGFCLGMAFDRHGDLFVCDLKHSADGTRLYVAETFRHAVSVIDVEEDGRAGTKRDLVALPGTWPDGLAVGQDGSLFVGCYQPSQVLRVGMDGKVDVVGEDVSAHLLAHPTNIAFQGDALITANVGRWHLTKIEVGLRGVLLPPPARPSEPTSPGAGS